MDPVLPLSPAVRSAMALSTTGGTLSLYAALDTRTGAIIGQPCPGNSDAFVEFLGDIVATQPSDGTSRHRGQPLGP